MNRSTIGMDPATASRPEPDGTATAFSVYDELDAVRKTRVLVMAPWEPGILPAAVLALCILVNLLFFLLRPDYFGLFVAASFYLNMYYFILLLIPSRSERTGLQEHGVSRFRAWFSAMGIASGTGQFTRLFANTIFMNSRALSPGIGLIFTVDIVFILIDFSRGLPLHTAVIVIAQCFTIVVFYLLVWRIEPFTSDYGRKIERAAISLRRLPPRVIAGILVSGFVMAICLFLITIILLPGVTLKAFLRQSELAALGNLFSLLAVLAVSQYFPIRFVHGLTSRSMAERLFDFRENRLNEILLRSQETPSAVDDTARDPVVRSLLTESRIYVVKRKTIAGSFPVFVVDLDFPTVTEITKLTTTRGYIHGKKPG